MKEEVLESYSTISKVISKTAIFGALSKDELREILSSMTLKKYEKGDIIFRQGGSPEYINVIEQGIVKLVRECNGETLEIKSLTEGQSFGETALLGILPYAITAVAATDVFLLQMSKFVFHDLSKTDPKLFSKFLLNIVREICRQNYNYQETVEKEVDIK